VENESGSLGLVRDFSPMAQKQFDGAVPAELAKALGKKPGTWAETFGTDADETFAAWSVARYINAGLLVPETIPRIGAWLERAERGGWKAVAILRLLPVPHPITNYALGLTRLSLGAYLWGSLLGLVPSTFAFVDLGLGGRNAAFGVGSWITPVLWGVGLLVFSALLSRLFRRRLG